MVYRTTTHNKIYNYLKYFYIIIKFVNINTIN